MINSQDDKPKIAILMACYNGIEFIEEQVNSILWQYGVNPHLYIRDDGSTDGTDELVLSLAKQYSQNITVLSDTGGPTGSAAANFFAILKSIEAEKYDYISFADQDDIWLPLKLKSAINNIIQNGGGGYSSDMIVWDTVANLGRPLVKTAKQQPLDYLFQGASAGCTYVLDRSAAAIVISRIMNIQSPYCSNISHDWVVYAICRSAGQKWKHDEQAHILYRQHQTNVYGAMTGVAGLASKLKMSYSGWYRNHILWLTHVLDNDEDERFVMTKLNSNKIADRLKLAFMAHKFRRNTSGVWFLRIAFLLGLI